MVLLASTNLVTAETSGCNSACKYYSARQSMVMETKWAVDNLQTIRTLMERSALYRRALAPIMILVGSIGIAAGLVGWLCQIASDRAFVGLWGLTAVISIAGALLLMRRQALKEAEPFWSPPTRRVCQALLPAFFVGLLAAGLALVFSSDPGVGGIRPQMILVITWALFYGCAVHAAGFFMPRGIRWLGWLFIILGSVLMSSQNLGAHWADPWQPNLLMGGIFGGVHLAYGIYLYFTEQRTPTA
jgi:hypothetical protein